MTAYKPEFEQLIYERKGKNGEVLWLTLNNEKMRNSLTLKMQAELLEALEHTLTDNSIRCVVLTGAGDKAFCSGGDINLFQSLDVVSSYDYSFQQGYRIQHLLTYMEKPVIAAVNGACYAGGLELALCCDFIYAAANATFGLLEINLGILAGWGGTVRLPGKIPVNRAKEMIYKGEIIDAAEAYQWGLVNKVTPREQLYEAVEATVAAMMAKPPLALRGAKNVINNSITCDSIEAALAIERGTVMWLLRSEDVKEGLSAFVEKRPPTFKGQ
ncbi:MAG: enoyl-CoA hydratase/isomerase family protein [Firmicutes bacterium]|nr:enoyl-CoA hydratase/isomerase family protein [Bacillota bacterium]